MQICGWRCSGGRLFGFPGLLATFTSAGARAIIIGSNKRGFGGRGGWENREGRKARWRLHPQTWRIERGPDGEDNSVSGFHPQRWGRLQGRSDVAEQGSEVAGHLDFAVHPWCQWRVGEQVRQGLDDVIDTGEDKVSGRGEGHCDLGREPG
jgi:hypothetical protein